MQKKKINIREIAKTCQVSPATVSRALSGKAPVREETRLKIEQAIRDTGYQSRQEMRKRREDRIKTVGVFIPTLSHVFFQYVLCQLRDLLDERGDYMVILPEKGPEIVEQIKKLDLDGVILLNEEISSTTVKRIQQMQISTVICSALSLNRLCPAVHVDDLAAAYDGTNYLIGLGHRHIGFICDSPRSISSGFQRIAGSQKAMEDHGLPLQDDCIYTGAGNYAGGYEAAKALLSRQPELTAIFAHCDAAAIGAMAALMDLGLSIPGDVSVLGFDNTNLGEEFRPRLTCVSQPIHDLIVQSLELLYAGMKQAAWEIPPSITLPHSIKVRDSCRALDS